MAKLAQKLARQRKLLDELSVQKAEAKSTWNRRNVLACILFNNLLAVSVGYLFGTVFFGVGMMGEILAIDHVTAESIM